MKVKLWGTRGSIPVPGAETVKYGGNTTCVEVTFDDNTFFVIDAGIGIRKLGQSLFERKIHHVNLYITHSHWDHIQGFPFFKPAFNSKNSINIYGCPPTYRKLQDILTNQMEYEYFPVKFEDLTAEIDFTEVCLSMFVINENVFHTIQTNHPGNTTGLKIESNGKIFIFLTDNELQPPPNSHNNTQWADFVEFCHNADVLVHDAQFTDDEIPKKLGWGHSSTGQAIRLATEAKVKSLYMTHHDPEHTDDFIDKMYESHLQELKQQGNPLKLFMAKDGLEIPL